MFGWRRLASVSFCVGFSAILLYLAQRGTDFAHIIQSLGRTNLTQVGVAVILLFFSFWVRAWRWRYLLLSVKRVRIMPLFRSTMVGFMGNYLLPLHAGELVRAASVGQTQAISKSSALGSIALERLLDGITLCLFPFVLLAVLDLPAWVVQLNCLLFGVYVMGFAVIMHSGSRGRMDIWLKRFFSHLPQRMAVRLNWTVELFLHGMSGLSSGCILLPVSLLSVFCWLLHGMYYYLLFQALGLSLSLWAALVLQTVIGIGVMLPAGPGYIGNFEYATVLGLALFGIEREEAFAYALLAHSLQCFPVIAVGLLFAFRGEFQIQAERQPIDFSTQAPYEVDTPTRRSM
jgi:uncharacterized protein (TIRG00374 family)